MLEPKWLVWFAKNDFRIDVRSKEEEDEESWIPTWKKYSILFLQFPLPFYYRTAAMKAKGEVS